MFERAGGLGACTEITIHLKRTPQVFFSRAPYDRIEQNIIAMRIQPNESITVRFGVKRPATVMRAETVNMDFCDQTALGVRWPAAPETLLLDTMRGAPTLLTRWDGVEAQWKTDHTHGGCVSPTGTPRISE